jgi:hypothetical protein
VSSPHGLGSLFACCTYAPSPIWLSALLKSGHPRLAVDFLEQPHLAAILLRSTSPFCVAHHLPIRALAGRHPSSASRSATPSRCFPWTPELQGRTSVSMADQQTSMDELSSTFLSYGAPAPMDEAPVCRSPLCSMAEGPFPSTLLAWAGCGCSAPPYQPSPSSATPPRPCDSSRCSTKCL